MKKYLRKQIFVSSCAYVGQMLVGYSLGWTAPIIPKLLDPEQTPLSAVISDTEASLIGSVLYIGCIAGPYLTGYLSNIKGRKLCLQISAVSGIISSTFISFGTNLATVFLARILMGVSVGIVFVFNLVYIGEIASSNIRGMLLSVTGVFVTLGTLLIYSVGPYVSYAATGYIGLVISVVFLIGLFFIPETPMFYVLNGYEDKAKEVLKYLDRSDDYDSIYESSHQYAQMSKLKNWNEIMTVKSNRKALLITVTLNILQQMSGVIVVLFFATTIFDLVESNLEPEISTIIIGVTQFASSAVSPVFVDRSGRKVLLLVSSAVCCLSLATLGTYFYFSENNYNVTNFQWLPLATLILFFTSYDMGFGIIPSTFIGEMFSPNVRSWGSTITVTVGWLFGFFVTSMYGYLNSAAGAYGTFWIFSGACAIAFLFTLFVVPETKQKSLAEIQEMLSK